MTVEGGRELEAGLAAANGLSVAELRQALRACCGSSRWVEAVAAARPFGSWSELWQAAERAAAELCREDWLEAFGHHPRIGDVEALRVRFGNAASQSWSRGEQAAVAGADDAILARLAAGNRNYEERFGHLFIVCASGKSAPQMLEILERRLEADPAAELAEAAAEQMKITELRLARWLRELAPEESTRP